MVEVEFNLTDSLMLAFRDRFLGETGNTRAMRMSVGVNRISKLEPKDISGEAWMSALTDAATYFQNLHELFYSEDSEYGTAVNEGTRLNGYNNIPYIDYSHATNITYNSNLGDESTNCINDLGRTFEAKPVYNSDNRETMKLSVIIAKKSKVSEVITSEEIDYV